MSRAFLGLILTFTATMAFTAHGANRGPNSSVPERAIVTTLGSVVGCRLARAIIGNKSYIVNSCGGIVLESNEYKGR